jgi:hypothetical protein
VFTARDTGTYIAIVSSFEGNPPGGSYDLTLARGAAALLDEQLEPGIGKDPTDKPNPVALKPHK